MKTKEQRYNELYGSGIVDAIKQLFTNRSDISEDYYVLMADYIDSMNEIKDEMLINPIEIARRMPELVKSIQETRLGGIYGRTDDNRIQIEQSLSYEDKKLYFFHELTHALQTSHENGREQCGFFDGHDGMFLTEGATQYTAEMLYNVSNGTNMQHRQQPRTVRGASNRTPYSPLSEYQYNGNVLELLVRSMDLPLPQVLALAYKKDGRETLKGIYESMEGNQGKFDDLMNSLEQIYSIDKVLIMGNNEHIRMLQSEIPTILRRPDGTTFKGNMNIYRELMNKTERELVATYIENHDTEYILHNYDEIAQFLTTPELRNDFLQVVHILEQDLTQSSRGNIVNFEEDRRNRQPQTNKTEFEMSEGYSINRFGEIIRHEQGQRHIEMDDDIPIFTPPNETQQIGKDNQQNVNKLTISQRIAQFLQKNDMLMNISFIEKFVDRQLNVLPHSSQNRTQPVNSSKEDFVKWLSNNGEYRSLPAINPERMAQMRRKMEQKQNADVNNEKGR